MRGECDECVVAAASRRAFLRDVGLAVVAAIGATVVVSPAVLPAQPATEATPSRILGNQRIYAIPSDDSISVDAGSDVIIARWQ